MAFSNCRNLEPGVGVHGYIIAPRHACRATPKAATTHLVLSSSLTVPNRACSKQSYQAFEFRTRYTLPLIYAYRCHYAVYKSPSSRWTSLGPQIPGGFRDRDNFCCCGLILARGVIFVFNYEYLSPSVSFLTPTASSPSRCSEL